MVIAMKTHCATCFVSYTFAAITQCLSRVYDLNTMEELRAIYQSLEEPHSAIPRLAASLRLPELVSEDRVLNLLLVWFGDKLHWPVAGWSTVRGDFHTHSTCTKQVHTQHHTQHRTTPRAKGTEDQELLQVTTANAYTPRLTEHGSLIVVHLNWPDSSRSRRFVLHITTAT